MNIVTLKFVLADGREFETTTQLDDDHFWVEPPQFMKAVMEPCAAVLFSVMGTK